MHGRATILQSKIVTSPAISAVDFDGAAPRHGNHGNCVILQGFALLWQPGKSRKANKPRLRLQAIALHSGRLPHNRENPVGYHAISSQFPQSILTGLRPAKIDSLFDFFFRFS
jgi:hypothetical protein